MFPSISKHREVGWKNEAQPRVFLTNFEAFAIGGNTLSSV